MSLRPSVDLAAHRHGVSTGWDLDSREDWPRALANAESVSEEAVELSVLSEPEVSGLLEFLEAGHPASDYLERVAHVSIHGPVKRLPRRLDELDEVIERLAALRTLLTQAVGLVVHPDVFDAEALRALRRLGDWVVLENMDRRKKTARTAFELAPCFEALPKAGFCLDVAHAWSVDPSLAVGHELLDAYGDRLREVHVSGVTAEGVHRETTQADLDRYEPLLRRVVDVPWILESPFVG